MTGLPNTGDRLSPTKLLHGSWLWPESDTRAAEFVFKRLPDLYAALEKVPGRGICVQAGGNCGVWPKHLATEFEVVYTFEPDPLNFRCLCANVPEENVFKYNAGLDDGGSCMSMVHKPDNAGAGRMEGKGIIPAIPLDVLNLPGCDFLQLDIEGMEHGALLGAKETIMLYRPVIMIEDKTFNRRAIERGQGIEEAGSQCSRLLRSWGYDIIGHWNSDFLYAWNPV